VSWESLNLVGGPDVFGRRFSPLTTPDGPAFPVNADTAPVREGGAIARDAEGRFVIVWVRTTSRSGASGGCRTERRSGRLQVNTSTPSNLKNPRVASDPSGNFVVTWSTTAHAVARRFDSQGAPLDDEFEVAEYTTVPSTRRASRCRRRTSS
jgi:hypothetical protein